MAREIERKFLVKTDRWKPLDSGIPYIQGYIATSVPGQTVRVRVLGDEGRLTIKGPSRGLTRSEYEYPIPVQDARELLETLCSHPTIAKTRHRVVVDSHTWEVDVFHGENEGLVVAEVELTSENEFVEIPDWVGAEVSYDPRYANSQLAKNPYSQWEKS